MGFQLTRTPTFSWPVSFREPIDGSRYRQHTLTVVYKRVPQSRLEEIQLAYQNLKADVSQDVRIHAIPTRETADEILVGWFDIFEDDGTTQIPYSKEVKAKLLEVPGLADVLVQTYIEAIEKAKAKN